MVRIQGSGTGGAYKPKKTEAFKPSGTGDANKTPKSKLSKRIERKPIEQKKLIKEGDKTPKTEKVKEPKAKTTKKTGEIGSKPKSSEQLKRIKDGDKVATTPKAAPDNASASRGMDLVVRPEETAKANPQEPKNEVQEKRTRAQKHRSNKAKKDSKQAGTKKNSSPEEDFQASAPQGIPIGLPGTPGEAFKVSGPEVEAMVKAIELMRGEEEEAVPLTTHPNSPTFTSSEVNAAVHAFQAIGASIQAYQEGQDEKQAEREESELALEEAEAVQIEEEAELALEKETALIEYSLQHPYDNTEPVMTRPSYAVPQQSTIGSSLKNTLEECSDQYQHLPLASTFPMTSNGLTATIEPTDSILNAAPLSLDDITLSDEDRVDTNATALGAGSISTGVTNTITTGSNIEGLATNLENAITQEVLGIDDVAGVDSSDVEALSAVAMQPVQENTETNEATTQSPSSGAPILLNAGGGPPLAFAQILPVNLLFKALFSGPPKPTTETPATEEPAPIEPIESNEANPGLLASVQTVFEAPGLEGSASNMERVFNGTIGPLIHLIKGVPDPEPVEVPEIDVITLEGQEANEQVLNTVEEAEIAIYENAYGVVAPEDRGVLTRVSDAFWYADQHIKNFLMPKVMTVNFSESGELEISTAPMVGTDPIQERENRIADAQRKLEAHHNGSVPLTASETAQAENEINRATSPTGEFYNNFGRGISEVRHDYPAVSKVLSGAYQGMVWVQEGLSSIVTRTNAQTEAARIYTQGMQDNLPEDEIRENIETFYAEEVSERYESNAEYYKQMYIDGAYKPEVTESVAKAAVADAHFEATEHVYDIDQLALQNANEADPAKQAELQAQFAAVQAELEASTLYNGEIGTIIGKQYEDQIESELIGAGIVAAGPAAVACIGTGTVVCATAGGVSSAWAPQQANELRGLQGTPQEQIKNAAFNFTIGTFATAVGDEAFKQFFRLAKGLRVAPVVDEIIPDYVPSTTYYSGPGPIVIGDEGLSLIPGNPTIPLAPSGPGPIVLGDDSFIGLTGNLLLEPRVSNVSPGSGPIVIGDDAALAENVLPGELHASNPIEIEDGIITLVDDTATGEPAVTPDSWDMSSMNLGDETTPAGTGGALPEEPSPDPYFGAPEEDIPVTGAPTTSPEPPVTGVAPEEEVVQQLSPESTVPGESGVGAGPGEQSTLLKELNDLGWGVPDDGANTPGGVLPEEGPAPRTNSESPVPGTVPEEKAVPSILDNEPTLGNQDLTQPVEVNRYIENGVEHIEIEHPGDSWEIRMNDAPPAPPTPRWKTWGAKAKEWLNGIRNWGRRGPIGPEPPPTTIAPETPSAPSAARPDETVSLVRDTSLPASDGVLRDTIVPDGGNPLDDINAYTADAPGYEPASTSPEQLGKVDSNPTQFVTPDDAGTGANPSGPPVDPDIPWEKLTRAQQAEQLNANPYRPEGVEIIVKGDELVVSIDPELKSKLMDADGLLRDIDQYNRLTGWNGDSGLTSPDFPEAPAWTPAGNQYEVLPWEAYPAEISQRIGWWELYPENNPNLRTANGVSDAPLTTGWDSGSIPSTGRPVGGTTLGTPDRYEPLSSAPSPLRPVQARSSTPAQTGQQTGPQLQVAEPVTIPPWKVAPEVQSVGAADTAPAPPPPQSVLPELQNWQVQVADEAIGATDNSIGLANTAQVLTSEEQLARTNITLEQKLIEEQLLLDSQRVTTQRLATQPELEVLEQAARTADDLATEQYAAAQGASTTVTKPKPISHEGHAIQPSPKEIAEATTSHQTPIDEVTDVPSVARAQIVEPIEFPPGTTWAPSEYPVASAPPVARAQIVEPLEIPPGKALSPSLYDDVVSAPSVARTPIVQPIDIPPGMAWAPSEYPVASAPIAAALAPVVTSNWTPNHDAITSAENALLAMSNAPRSTPQPEAIANNPPATATGGTLPTVEEPTASTPDVVESSTSATPAAETTQPPTTETASNSTESGAQHVAAAQAETAPTSPSTNSSTSNPAPSVAATQANNNPSNASSSSEPKSPASASNKSSGNKQASAASPSSQVNTPAPVAQVEPAIVPGLTSVAPSGIAPEMTWTPEMIRALQLLMARLLQMIQMAEQGISGLSPAPALAASGLNGGGMVPPFPPYDTATNLPGSNPPTSPPLWVSPPRPPRTMTGRGFPLIVFPHNTNPNDSDFDTSYTPQEQTSAPEGVVHEAPGSDSFPPGNTSNPGVNANPSSNGRNTPSGNASSNNSGNGNGNRPFPASAFPGQRPQGFPPQYQAPGQYPGSRANGGNPFNVPSSPTRANHPASQPSQRSPQNNLANSSNTNDSENNYRWLIAGQDNTRTKRVKFQEVVTDARGQRHLVTTYRYITERNNQTRATGTPMA